MSRVLFTFRVFLILSAVVRTACAYSLPVKHEGKEIVITSSSLVVESKENSALFEGSVVATFDKVTIYSDKMKVIYRGPEKKIAEVRAIGNVRVHNEGKAIFAHEAQYNNEEEKIVFTGNPRVAEGDNMISGTRIIYFLNDDRAIVEGSRVILKDITTDE